MKTYCNKCLVNRWNLFFLHKWNLVHKRYWLFFHKQIASFYSDTSPDPHQFSSLTQLCLTLFNPMDCSSPGFPVHHQLLELTQIHDLMPSNHLILCRPLLLLLSIFPSIRVFSNESALHIRWPNYWNFSFSISPSNEHPGPISFRMDWLNLLANQGTLKSLLQHHSSKASILRRSAFFMIQLSHPYMTAGKTTGLTSGTFVGEVMSLLFNMLSRLVTGFLPRSKNLLISWLKSPSAVILEPPKNMCIKWFSTSVTPFSPIITHKFMIMVTVLIPKQFHLMVIIPSSDFFGHLLLIWLICYRFIGFLPAIFFISFYIVTEVSYATGYLAQTPGHGIKTHKIVNTWWER